MPSTVNRFNTSTCSKEKQEDSTQTIAGSLRRFFSGTLLSRVTGLGRDATMAASFGSDPAIAAFMVAYRFSHLLRRILGEGALHAAFIPQFEKARHDQPENAVRFFRDLSVALMFLLSVIIAIVTAVLFAFKGSFSEGNQQITDLLLVMLPSALFLSLFGINTALLQCEKRYFLPAAAPIAFNLVWISGVLFLWGESVDEAVKSLGWVIVVACVGQWLVTLPAVYRVVQAQLWSPLNFSSPELKGLAKALSLGLVGVGAAQLNSALDALFARYADLSGPAYLWWAVRIQQAPIGLFGVAMAGALLPPLSRARKQGKHEQFEHFLQYALQKAALFMIPFMVALWIGGLSSVNLVYGRGYFDTASVVNTTLCLWSYSLGMVPTVFVMLLAPAYYAQGNYRIPTLAASLAVAVNLILNTVLIYGAALGPFSVALATSISSFINCAILIFYLREELSSSFWSAIRKGLVRASLISLLGFIAAYVAGLWFEDPSLAILLGARDVAIPQLFLEQLLHYSTMATAFAVALGVSYLWIRKKPSS